jgi:hypothetical protein
MPGVGKTSHWHTGLIASTGAGLANLAGTTKLATSINIARTPNILGYFIFIIPPKLLNPKNFFSGTFGELRLIRLQFYTSQKGILSLFGGLLSACPSRLLPKTPISG